VSHKNFLTFIIISDIESEPESFALCLQALIANTDSEKANIIIYLSESSGIDFSYLEKNLILESIVEVRICNFTKYSQILAHAISNSLQYSAIVLLTSQAIVSQGWLDALNKAAMSREDIAIVTSRNIRHRNDLSALELIPYATNRYDVDVAISPSENNLLDPDFDESQLLVRLSRLKLFCLYFQKNILEYVDWQNLVDLDDFEWQDAITNIVNNTKNMKMVYTPKAKVFHSSYFQFG
jgi:hypothetical protein